MDHSVINIFRGAGFGDYFLLIYRSTSASEVAFGNSLFQRRSF